MAEILLVDDQSEVRTLLSRVLAAAGHSVNEAADGEQALQWLESHRPDVVITDIFMPKADGFDVAHALQKFDHPPVVISITGDPRSVTHDLALQLGVRATLIKPFAPKELLAAIKESLETQANAS